MKTHYLLGMLIANLLMSCTNYKSDKDTGDCKTLDYGYFSICVPKDWTRVDIKGIDSFVGRIDIDSSTSVGFDLGWYSNSLDEGRRTEYYNIESGDVYIPDSTVNQNFAAPTAWKYLGKADSTTIEKLKRHRITWIDINHYKAKIVTPKKTGIGITGVYIDSLWKAGDAVDRFVLSGHNLTQTQQNQLLNAIRSLKFKRRQI